MPAPDSIVSVIIPVYNDAARLRLCLEALEAQRYPRERFEVIVVDNNSSEDIQRVVEDYPQARYGFESSPGSYAARNWGLGMARGELLAFTDADCIPKPDWLEEGVGALLAAPDCGLVGGEIELFFKTPGKPTLAELHETAHGFAQKEFVEGQYYSVTANLFTFRQRFDEVGFFSQVKSGGDREWCQRLVKAGYQLVYAPSAVVAHPARASLREMLTREMRFTGTAYREMMAENSSTSFFVRHLVRRVRKIPRQSLRFYRQRGVELGYDQRDRAKIALAISLKRLAQVVELARLRLGGDARR